MPGPTHWLAMLLLGVCCAAAFADPPADTELNGDPIATATYRAWASNYRTIARWCGEVDGQYLVVPGYARRTPSSRGLTIAQATDELTETWRESSGGISQRRMREPDPAEVAAYATIIPAMDVGQYGNIASAEIVAILGPEEMLIKELQLVDARALRDEYQRDERRARANGVRDFREALNGLYEHRLALKDRQEDDEAEVLEATHRLVGYDTRGLAVGERWAGPEEEGIRLAVAWMEAPETEEDDRSSRYRSSRRSEPRLVLVNPDPVLRRPLDEAGMKRLLDVRGYTVASFVEAMRDIRDAAGRDRDEADLRLARMLLPPPPDEDEEE